MEVVLTGESPISQPEQFGFALEGMGNPVKPVSAHAVRLELYDILETAKAAQDHAPWDMELHRKHRATFSEKAKILPPEEAEFLRRQFVMELERIELLLAA
jgi:hypothetical protein